jgi:hypothetical protein
MQENSSVIASLFGKSESACLKCALKIFYQSVYGILLTSGFVVREGKSTKMTDIAYRPIVDSRYALILMKMELGIATRT